MHLFSSKYRKQFKIEYIAPYPIDEVRARLKAHLRYYRKPRYRFQMGIIVYRGRFVSENEFYIRNNFSGGEDGFYLSKPYCQGILTARADQNTLMLLTINGRKFKWYFVLPVLVFIGFIFFTQDPKPVASQYYAWALIVILAVIALVFFYTLFNEIMIDSILQDLEQFLLLKRTGQSIEG